MFPVRKRVPTNIHFQTNDFIPELTIVVQCEIEMLWKCTNISHLHLSFAATANLQPTCTEKHLDRHRCSGCEKVCGRDAGLCAAFNRGRNVEGITNLAQYLLTP